MKKLILLLIATFLFTNSCSAFTWKFEQTDEDLIKKLMRKHVRYSNRTNADKLTSLYDTNYKSADGFNLEVYSKMIEDIWNTYDDLEYSMEIKNISINNESAKVEVIEKTYSKITESKIYQGELKSEADTVYYLKKLDKKWKVVADRVLSENTTILYGEARGLDVKLTAPNEITANTDYSAILEFAPPEGTLAIASISADPVEYPQKPTKEVFRVLPDENMLERLFTSNSNNTNEFIVASIGLTRTNVCDLDLQLSLTGFGYAMKRINVLSNNEGINSVKN